MSSRYAFLLAGLVLSAPLSAKRNPPATVGSVAQTNGLSANGYLQVRTPSILRVEPGQDVPADARAAIDQYDKLAALSPAAVDPALRSEALRRASDLRVQLAEADNSTGHGFHVSDVRRAIADYMRVLTDYPLYAMNDRVLYQLARAYQMVDETDASITALTRLGASYPQSARAPDALFRAGEMLFARSRFRDAEPAYAGLLALGPDAPYYEYAQYKYGWALYKQSQYERAAEVFLAILDRDLPPGTLEDAAVVQTVARDKLERVSESLRVTALSFAALGGGPAVNAHFARAPRASRMETLIYSALGEALLQKDRYTDAAGTYVAFIERHPEHARAPEFQARAIGAYREGGFGDLAIRAQERYVALYAPDAAYWSTRTRDDTVLAEVRQHLDELGRYYQARAQQITEPTARQAGYLAAAAWYRRTLDLFPKDPRAADTSLLLADALLEGGRIQDAAKQYEFTAYVLPAHSRSPVAAIATVQAWQRLTRETAGAAHAEAQRASIAASLKLADSFGAHPQRTQVLMAAAEDQYDLRELDAAISTADRVLKAQPAQELRIGALGVIADAQFAQKKYPEAEAAYAELVGLPAPSIERRTLSIEQLAASVYKQAEAARDAGDLKLAASHFQRVAAVAPTASIRSSADYDAASTLIALEEWPRAAVALESFRVGYPNHRLLPDIDKKLALAYEKSGKPSFAAGVMDRIALREQEPVQTRREAAWTAAQLYDKAGIADQSTRAYLFYVSSYPQPLDPAMQARQRLADLFQQRDPGARRHWLDEIVLADQSAGSARSEVSKRLAAQASLEIGRLDAAAARQLALRVPLDQSLTQRRLATENTVRVLERAAAYGYADITSAATYELATVYMELGRALMESERPAKLTGEAVEQYQILLEEQAFPFEEKAIRAHEINLARMRNGTWNESIRKSVAELGQLSPAKYGKQEKREATYDELH
ncbi:MAG: tetratricopeptide repeat protein [Panacagrimonas sp.]